jgi:hypothetical protein
MRRSSAAFASVFSAIIGLSTLRSAEESVVSPSSAKSSELLVKSPKIDATSLSDPKKLLERIEITQRPPTLSERDLQTVATLVLQVYEANKSLANKSISLRADAPIVALVRESFRGYQESGAEHGNVVDLQRLGQFLLDYASKNWSSVPPGAGEPIETPKMPDGRVDICVVPSAAETSQADGESELKTLKRVTTEGELAPIRVMAAPIVRFEDIRKIRPSLDTRNGSIVVEVVIELDETAARTLRERLEQGSLEVGLLRNGILLGPAKYRQPINGTTFLMGPIKRPEFATWSKGEQP